MEYQLSPRSEAAKQRSRDECSGTCVPRLPPNQCVFTDACPLTPPPCGPGSSTRSQGRQRSQCSWNPGPQPSEGRKDSKRQELRRASESLFRKAGKQDNGEKGGLPKRGDAVGVSCTACLLPGTPLRAQKGPVFRACATPWYAPWPCLGAQARW